VTVVLLTILVIAIMATLVVLLIKFKLSDAKDTKEMITTSKETEYSENRSQLFLLSQLFLQTTYLAMCCLNPIPLATIGHSPPMALQSGCTVT